MVDVCARWPSVQIDLSGITDRQLVMRPDDKAHLGAHELTLHRGVWKSATPIDLAGVGDGGCDFELSIRSMIVARRVELRLFVSTSLADEWRESARWCRIVRMLDDRPLALRLAFDAGDFTLPAEVIVDPCGRAKEGVSI